MVSPHDPRETHERRRHPDGRAFDYTLNTERPATYEPGAVVFAGEVRRARLGTHLLTHCANLRFLEAPMTVKSFAALAACALLAGACKPAPREAAVQVDQAQLAMFAPLPDEISSPDNPITEPKIALGRMLYFERRISQNGNQSCNDCHHLEAFGADTGRFSAGSDGRLGGRNSPTVYNAAGHFAQFWDGRAPTVEEQAKGPIMNPVEMGMPNAAAVMRVIRADPAYVAAFRTAFPGERDPMTYDNLGRAIGAFERRLVTPSRWDRFLHGEDSALSNDEKAGFNAFVSVGCASCHNGAFVGGMQYQRAGLVNPWPDTADVGRMAVTHDAADRMVFKVPSLRNIERTPPYFHDGWTRSLDTAIAMMSHHQLGKPLTADEARVVTAWLRSLTGTVPAAYIAPPARRAD
jgi:cytochrome c peroxidase